MMKPIEPASNVGRRYRPWRTTKEIPLMILGIFWFFLCTFLMCLMNVYLDHHNPYLLPPPSERIRLPDPLLDFLHPSYVRQHIPEDLSDTVVHFAPVFMLLRVAVAGCDASLILRRLGYLVGTGYLIRIFFVSMTILPAANVNCEVETTSLLWDTLLAMLQIRQTCGDVAFSGHTIMFMSASLVWVENPVDYLKSYPILSQLLDSILIFYSFGGILSLVASAYHYTIDCVISVSVMLFLWKFYHYAVTQPHLDHTSIGRFLCFIDGQRRFKTEPSPSTQRRLSRPNSTTPLIPV